MFENLEMAPPDAILGLTEAYKNDPNPAKINLGVGVYKDEYGNTPILASVKEAERRLLETEHEKGYLTIAGMADFDIQVRRLLLGSEEARPAATVQTPGGTGALRVAADFLSRRFPGTRIWCSKPTWANHPAVFSAAGLEVHQYTYSDAAHEHLDFQGYLDALEQIPSGDVVCLHACCHNPTGIDPDELQWKEIAQRVRSRKLLPLVDFAYQGFGDGLREDARGLELLLEACEELLICNSFSKNFGLYAERVGALTVVAPSAQSVAIVLSNLKIIVRTNYSNPPKHGAAIVAAVLSDPDLQHMWRRELSTMRDRINGMRSLFVQKMQERGVAHDFSFMREQRGMFSLSGLTPMQVDELRRTHSIYIVGNGRINVAGMTRDNMDTLCDAIADVLGNS